MLVKNPLSTPGCFDQDILGFRFWVLGFGFYILTSIEFLTWVKYN
jgi:hypothetical protein